MKKAELYEKLENKLVKCTACSHYCRIGDGRAGVCAVRKNIDGELYLLVYGKAIAVNIDPIEKKPLYHFLPGTSIFSIGTLGCNFACSFCQNWDISQASKQGREVYYGQELPPEKIVDYCVKNNIPSIAYTYNEPAIFFEYAYDTAKLAKEHGIKNVFVSNGYESEEALEKIRPYLDAINIDLKAFTSDFYLKICKGRIEPVLNNIKRVYEMGVWVEITTLVIPGKNDSDGELKQIAEFIAGISKDIPWHISRFHPDYKMTDLEITPETTLAKAYNIGKKSGLKYIYLGNVYDQKRESTYCHKCGKKVLSRTGYIIKENKIKGGKCFNCGEKIFGVWS